MELIGVVIWLLAIVASVLIGVIVNRLVFSSLASIPGPWLAAATGWYETYYDVIRGGQFMYEIQRLHRLYGPVVRISPREVHVNAAEFYDILYAGPTRRRHKDPWFLSSVAPGTSFAANNSDHHRMRRSGLNPFFSKQAIREWEPIIHSKMRLLCRHFRRAQHMGHPLELHTCFVNFAVDTVSQYTFGPGDGFDVLQALVTDDTWKKGVNGIFEMLVILRHLPWLYDLSRVLPVFISAWICPAFPKINAIEQEIERQTGKVYTSTADKTSIIGHIMRNDKLPAAERTLARLTDEAKFLLVAGTDAPSQVMSITIYHILCTSCVYNRLREELQMALPNADMDACWGDLERLPYLTAVIKEGLRLAAVVTSRLPRIAPEEDLFCGSWRIPAGTVVSMSNHFILRNDEIFPDPLAFHPERWLSASSDMNRFLVPFSKGSQGCLGYNMAYCWLYIGVATLLRRYDLTLVDTDERNVTVIRDCFNGQTAPGQNHIKVMVLSEE